VTWPVCVSVGHERELREKTRNAATADGPRDALCQPNFVHCCTTVGRSCTTNPQQIEVTELGHYVDRHMLYVRPARSRRDVVDKLDRRRVMLRIRSLCVAKFSKSRAGTKFQRKVPSFLRYPNFLIKQCRIAGRKLPCRKPCSSILSVVFIELQLVTDVHRQTDTGS